MINILSMVFVLTGLLLIITEQIFHYSPFANTSTIGFIIIIAGVLLVSFKISKESKLVKRKYYGNSTEDSSAGYFPHSKKHDSSSSDPVTSGDFSAGSGGDGG